MEQVIMETGIEHIGSEQILEEEVGTQMEHLATVKSPTYPREETLIISRNGDNPISQIHTTPAGITIADSEAEKVLHLLTSLVRIVHHQSNKSTMADSQGLQWIFKLAEKKEGNNPTAASMNDFRDFMSNNQLMEVPNCEFHLTWWNKQVGEFKILGKLDRMLCNAN
ncbi:hypothetical protein IFM89_039280 [Coptis chinensis]|uniref:Uncharacterized protein n=1 Tax=Coptis chinensis TaxID=261450 RepID=A0A835I8N4_9MAGN|nr:hypothetical protein IFM89_039280 [Coptis chinensis]